MNFYSALRAIRDVLAHKPDIYVVNEGATRSTSVATSRHVPSLENASTAERGSVGIGMGYAIGASALAQAHRSLSKA